MQPAAIGLVWDRLGRLLTVSRHEPPFEMALPGGHIEGGETAAVAFMREVQEETGVRVHDARYMGVAPSPTDGRDVYLFESASWDGTAYPREGGRVAWLTPSQLIAQAVLFKPQLRALFGSRRA